MLKKWAVDVELQHDEIKWLGDTGPLQPVRPVRVPAGRRDAQPEAGV